MSESFQPSPSSTLPMRHGHTSRFAAVMGIVALVQNRDVMALMNQTFGEVEPDESRAASNECSH